MKKDSLKIEPGDQFRIVKWALCFKKNTVLEYLIEKEVFTDTKADNEGNIALHYAVILRNFLAVEILLKSGSNPLAQNKSNASPYSIAEKINDQLIAGLLLNAIEKRALNAN